MNHFIIIRSAYSPSTSLALNEYRLSLTERFCVPSLAAQTNRDFTVELRTNCSDPLIDRRVSAFKSVGVSVLLTHSNGYALRTRMDDDDAIAVDFIERLRNYVCGDGWYTFPSGYVTDGQRFVRSRVVGNQFVSRLSDRGVFEVMHRHVPDPMIVDEQPAWLWVRHKHNRSPTAPSMRGSHPVSEIAEAFPCASV